MAGKELPGEKADILMESGVSLFDRKPFVVLRWGEMRGQLSPGEARQHALALLECAEAAVSDSALMRYLEEKVTMSFEDAGMLLVGLRKWRSDSTTTEEV